jgi:indole-3-glycerol phosphate synthase
MLSIIANSVRGRLQARSRYQWERDIDKRLQQQHHATRFRDEIAGLGERFIFEIKRTSPSSKEERLDIDVADRSRMYESAGASAISVLTEPEYFGGSLADLEIVSGAVSLPILRKDFIIDKLQIAEARAYGASAVLLIVALLPDKLLREFIEIATSHKLDALVEIHSLNELQRAVDCGASIIGVNNRDLKTLTIDLQIGANLLAQIPGSCIRVAESGLKTRENILMMHNAGANAFLVGSSVMQSSDPRTTIAELMGR